MARIFIIALDESIPEIDDRLTQIAKEKDLYWWNWINNFWIVIDDKSELTANALRKEINDVDNNVTTLVVEIEAFDWSGFGPSSEKDDKNMFNWLHKNLPLKARDK